MQNFRRERHSVSRLTAHLVCVTKYRRKIFDSKALEPTRLLLAVNGKVSGARFSDEPRCARRRTAALPLAEG